MAIFCVVVLGLIQLLLFFDESRIFLSRIDKLEGDRVALEFTPDNPGNEAEGRSVWQEFQILRRGQKMQIKVLTGSGNQVYIKINGNRAGTLAPGLATVTVYDGDYLEIDATLQTEPVSYQVVKVDPGIVSPFAGAILETRGDTAPIGRIKLKR
ncbi:hypothetical protein ALO_05548 [Acetonema longum DSM 6540]|uniref:Uncharacterized protein n=2 Tax=Acetonema TaxID=2373 RepID=F7NGC6_9FIRM|nr:hypothetical protein ALO_05548 [Acetonema longum DSM 6540]